MIAGTLMAEVAALIGDPSRANMLAAMLDGRAHAAAELAASAGITAPTASGHLAKLQEGGLIEVAAQGRHRYYRLASVDVARTLEGIMTLSAELPRSRATPRVPPALREARTCYDHLAGRLGVAIADALVADESITIDDGAAAVTEKGRVRLALLGIERDRPGGGIRRPLCRPCLDWSERRPHLAGVIGSALLERLLAQHWIRRTAESRAISITPLGASRARANVRIVASPVTCLSFWLRAAIAENRRVARQQGSRVSGHSSHGWLEPATEQARARLWSTS